MPLTIPSFPNPIDPAHPLTNAYGWISGLALDLSTGAGRLTVNVHPNVAASAAQPAAQIGVALGQPLVPADPAAHPPVAAVAFPTLAEMLADPAFAQAFGVIAAMLESFLPAVPALAGAAVVA